MTEVEILDDIKIILEGEFARQSQTGLKINNPNETFLLLSLLSNKLLSCEEKSFFWETLEKVIKSEPPQSLLSLAGDSTERLIHASADKIFGFFIKFGKVARALDYFNLERNVNWYLKSVIKATYILVMNEPSYLDRKFLTRLEDCLAKVSLQITKDREYDDLKYEYESKMKEEYRIVAVDGVKLKKALLPQAPKRPRPNYIKVEHAEAMEIEQLIKLTSQRIKLEKFNILKASYQGINLEINQDKQELSAKIKEFKFNPELNECLDKFEMDYQKADKFDLKSSVGHIRSFIEKLSVSISKELEKETLIAPTSEVTKFGEARQYFRDARLNFLSEKQDRFLEAFYGLASDEQVGAHSLSTDKEHARIIKNQSIELGLFLIKLMEKNLKKFKSLVV